MTRPERMAHWIIRHKFLLLFGVLVVVAALAAGMSKLQFSADNRGFLGGANQELADLRRLDDAYTSADAILVMVTPPATEAYSVDTLRALRRMTDDMWQIPYVLRVDSPIDHTHSYSLDDDILVEQPLPEDEEITPERAARFQEIVRDAPELRNRLIGPEGVTFGLVASVVLPEDITAGRHEVAGFRDGLLAQWRADYPEMQFHTTGSIDAGLMLTRAAVDDIKLLVPLAVLAVVILFTLLVGSYKAIGAAVTVSVLGLLVTFGFAGWLGIQLTAGTAISPLAVMVLISASCVHMVLSWQKAPAGGDNNADVAHALTENLGPIVITNVTTALGFLGLNFAQSPPLQEMGNIVAMGLMVGMVATLIIMPVGLLIWPNAPKARGLLANAHLAGLARHVVARHRVWLVVFPIAIAGAAIGISRISYDDNLTRYFDDRYEFRRDADAISAGLTGLDSLVFSFEAPEGQSIFDPAFLQQVDDFATWMETQETVVAVAGLPEILKGLHQSLNGDDPAEYRLANSSNANAQLLMFYELSLPVGQDMNTLMDVDRVLTRLSVTLRSDDSRQTRELATRADAWMMENTPEIATRASGITIAFARISKRNNEQMLYGLILVLIMVSAVMMLTLRSPKFGLISLAPNLVPALLAFGLWGWAFGTVNLGSTVVTTMTFGIVVDDTVHFLMHYMRRRRLGDSPAKAIEGTFNVVGLALVITSAALIAGFVIMAASGFAINQHIGGLTAVVVGFALIADLLFLPSILLVLDRSK